MKSKPIFLLLACCLQISLTAQTTEKIKGSREVTIKQTYVDEFNTISVGDEFQIDLIFNSKPSVSIEADDNLHEVIKFEVVDGVLSFQALKNITSKKALKITVNYANALNRIEVRNSAEIRSLTSMELSTVQLSVLDKARAYLNIKATELDFKASGKSKVRLNITSEKTKIELSDDSKLDAFIKSGQADFILYQRTDATIEGESAISTIGVDNSSNFLGNNFSVTNCTLKIEGSADATLEVLDLLTLDASGNTETFLYGNPKITVERLSGSAKLQKKER